VLELGGKKPLIIQADADPDLAVDAAVFGASDPAMSPWPRSGA
jgi:acyl-CoA reductase-like NAD-dependent aldehyde dehydrogenase